MITYMKSTLRKIKLGVNSIYFNYKMVEETLVSGGRKSLVA